MRSSIAILSLAATALAETQIPFWVPGLSKASDPGVSPAASIIKVESSTTVMALGCATTPSDGCIWDQFTYTVASSSVYAAVVSYDDLSVSFACTSAKAFQCELKEPASLIDESSTGALTVTTTVDKESLFFLTATVTAGENKLSGATGAPESSGAAKSAASGSTLTTSASAGATPNASGASPTGSAASASGSGAPAQSTGAAGKFGVEGAAWAVLAGAAAVQLL